MKKGCRIATTLVSFYNMVDEMSDNIAQLVHLVNIIVSLFKKKSIQQMGPFIDYVLFLRSCTLLCNFFQKIQKHFLQLRLTADLL